MLSILVTGGAGFIGSNLIKRLIKEDYSIVSLDNYSTGSINNHITGVEYITGDTKDISSLINFVPDIIFHFGEYSRVERSFNDIDKVIDYNYLGTSAVLAFVKENNVRLIYAGSSTKFGDNGSNSSPYAWSKSNNVTMIKNYGIWFNIDYAIVYFYNVYGAGELESGDMATLIGKFKRLTKNNEQLSVVSPGTQIRNFTHIDDTVDALLLVMIKGIGDGYGIGSSEPYTVYEVAKMFQPNNAPIMLAARPGNRMIADVVTAKTQSLGWEPKRSLMDYINE